MIQSKRKVTIDAYTGEQAEIRMYLEKITLNTQSKDYDTTLKIEAKSEAGWAEIRELNTITTKKQIDQLFTAVNKPIAPKESFTEQFANILKSGFETYIKSIGVYGLKPTEWKKG